MNNKCDSMCFVPPEWIALYRSVINSMETFVCVLKNTLFCSSFLGGKELTNYTLFNKCTILFSCCDKQKLSFEENTPYAANWSKDWLYLEHRVAVSAL